VAPSYQDFLGLTGTVEQSATKTSTVGDLESVLEAAGKRAAPNRIQVIAVDMPLSSAPIKSRRKADDLISKQFGALGCGTHSPTADRPGAVSSALLKELKRRGYKLQTCSVDIETPSLIEVLPHPALLALCDRGYRVPYKVNKTSKYWPDQSSSVRRSKLIEEMRKIVRFLGKEMTSIPPMLESEDAATMTTGQLKAIEDMIDALVCAWVGIQYLAGEVDAYGDETSAIWVPRRRLASNAEATTATST
jgi:predicted RNase H-like nuclease